MENQSNRVAIQELIKSRQTEEQMERHLLEHLPEQDGAPYTIIRQREVIIEKGICSALNLHCMKMMMVMMMNYPVMITEKNKFC